MAAPAQERASLLSTDVLRLDMRSNAFGAGALASAREPGAHRNIELCESHTNDASASPFGVTMFQMHAVACSPT
jgi:hypothetical protein